MPDTLEIKAVTKKFGDLIAINDVSLKVRAGTVMALIGPNGSGKTTLLNCAVGLLHPETGKILIKGIDIQEKPVVAKRLFSYISDNPAIYPYLSGLEFMRLTAKLHGLTEDETEKKIIELKSLFPIEEVLTARTESYSRGNLEKTAFLSAMISDPTLLIIDEPIVGLDPASVSIFGETLRRFARAGGAVLLSTHTLDFAREYADTIGIIYGGKLLKEFSVTAKTDIQDIYQRFTA